MSKFLRSCCLNGRRNPDKHIIIKRLETLSESEVAKRMRASLNKRDADEAFVFVHGYNVTFANAAKRTATDCI